MKFNLTDLQWIKKPSQGFGTITFDDGYLGNYQAAEIMKQENLSGTAYLIPKAINQPDYLTTEQILQIKAWGWDISSHHETPITEFGADERPDLLKSVKNTILKLGNVQMASHFAYPLGQYDSSSLGDIKKLFKSARLAGGGFESLPPADLYRIRSINVTPALSAEDLLAKADLAFKSGDWAVFMFHYLDQPDKGELNYSSSEFKKFIKGLSTKKNHIKTISEVLN
jgi:peptidoglycan/xylan/chitin deacetylase (PgdA/CDA1 family)